MLDGQVSLSRHFLDNGDVVCGLGLIGNHSQKTNRETLYLIVVLFSAKYLFSFFLF